MEIADVDVDQIVEEIAARFRNEEKKRAGGATPQARRSADSGAGAEGQVPHDG
jgi:hypothetical protein